MNLLTPEQTRRYDTLNEKLDNGEILNHEIAELRNLNNKKVGKNDEE